MGLFDKPTDNTEVLAELTALKKEVAGLRGERAAQKDAISLEAERTELKKKLTDLQITWDKEKEKWDREKREVEHMVGLQKKRGEFEVEAAKREAIVSVREESLKDKQDAFDEQVKFIEKRFDSQFASLNDLMTKFLSVCLPLSNSSLWVRGTEMAKKSKFNALQDQYQFDERELVYKRMREEHQARIQQGYMVPQYSTAASTTMTIDYNPITTYTGVADPMPVAKAIPPPKN